MQLLKTKNILKREYIADHGFQTHKSSKSFFLTNAFHKSSKLCKQNEGLKLKDNTKIVKLFIVGFINFCYGQRSTGPRLTGDGCFG